MNDFTNGLVRASSDSFPALTDRPLATVAGPFQGIDGVIVTRFLRGDDTQQIANDIGESRKFVSNRISTLRAKGFYIPQRRSREISAKRAAAIKVKRTINESIEALGRSDDTVGMTDRQIIDEIAEIRCERTTLQQSQDFIAVLRKFHPNREGTTQMIAFSRY